MRIARLPAVSYCIPCTGWVSTPWTYPPPDHTIPTVGRDLVQEIPTTRKVHGIRGTQPPPPLVDKMIITFPQLRWQVVIIDVLGNLL